MSSETVFTALSSLLSTLGFCYLLFWRYRTFRVDAFRQKMFRLRDEVFDYADAGNIDFSHKAYGVLRSTMNGYIRFGHRLTLWHVIFGNLLISEEDAEKAFSFSQVWEQATKGLDEKTKNDVEAYRRRMEVLAVKHTLFAAPEFFILFPVALVVFFLMVAFELGITLLTHRQKVREMAFLNLRRMFRGIDDTALLVGEGQRFAT